MLQALNNKWLFRGIIFIILLIRCADYIHSHLFNPDKLEQIIAAKNWIEDKGISRAWMETEFPDKPVYEALVQWPPGYSYLLGTFWDWTGNLFLSLILIDCISICLLAWLSWSWLKSFNTILPWQALIIWIIFMLNTAFAEHLTSVDLLSFACFFSALIILFSETSGLILARALFAGLLLACTIWFRYAYLPQVLALLGSGSIYMFLKDKKKLTQIWIPALTVAVSGILIFILIRPVSNPGYIDPEKSGLFWEHLTRFNFDFLGEIITGSVGIQRLISRVGTWAGIIPGLCLSGFITIFIICKIKDSSKLRLPLILIVGIIVINVLMLVGLSLTNSMQTWAAKGWTFVQEHRYYAPSWAALWILCISLFASLNANKYAQKILIVLFLFTVLDYSYYRKWKAPTKQTILNPGIHQLPDYPDYLKLADETIAMGKIPIQIIEDPYTSLIAESAGWIPVRPENSNTFPYSSEKYNLLIFSPADSNLTIPPLSLSFQPHQLSSGNTIFISETSKLWN